MRLSSSLLIYFTIIIYIFLCNLLNNAKSKRVILLRVSNKLTETKHSFLDGKPNMSAVS